MKKALVLLALLVLAAPASADVVLDLTAPQWAVFSGVNCVYFDLVIVDLGGHELTDQMVSGFGARLVLDGADAARFVGNTRMRNRATFTISGYVAPARYAWAQTFSDEAAGFAMLSTVDTGAQWVSFGHNSGVSDPLDDAFDRVRFADLLPGDVVARFVFADSAYMTPITDLVFSLVSFSAADSRGAIFTLHDGQTQVYGTLIPEPATMALLGLGLAGLAIRRRRGR